MKTGDSASQSLAPVAVMPSIAMPPSPSTQTQTQTQHRWNTKNLVRRIGADAASAACAGALIAPIITVIDR